MILQIYIASMVVGVLAFEWAWAKSYKMRMGDPEIDKLHPNMVRGDKPQKKWMHYPGAALLFLPKIIIAVFGLSLCFFIL